MSKVSKVVVFESGPAQEFYAPDGTVHTQPWWRDLTPPAAHPEIDIADSLLTQVAQDGPGGKQSCVLTSGLNALIATGQLAPNDAQRMQDDLVTDPDGIYARHWRRLGDSDFLGWTEDPATLAFFVSQHFGAPTSLEHIVSKDAADRVSQRLRVGHAAVVTGRSALGRHARLAFQPNGQEYEGQIFIHDPKYSETTGLYSYTELPQFQTAATAAVF
ncbi:MAG TPA: hypothetical protein VJP80_06475 [Candidatus Saccharimonadales bacterium]|nr:hypothetical protein [Candidatus Saccharimonadales bacterium]